MDDKPDHLADVVRLDQRRGDDRQLRAPALTDAALALEFAERHAGDMRYVAKWGRWLEWDGKRWRFDDTLHFFDLAREICCAAAMSCNKGQKRAKLASSQTVAAVVKQAMADRRLAACIGQWDADPWLLNTPGGVIDLRTGRCRPAQPGDFLTKMTAVAPGGACPTWMRFLARIANGNAELVAFFQRVFGYSLTGITREHALFFGHGTGGNGKGVLLNTVAAIFGDYHKTAPIETFTATSGDRHPTELAGLMGARLVSASETEEGRRWAESKVKMLTGGDVVSARLMRQDFFEFMPQFKLFVTGNHKPGLRSVDEAIRRRFHLIPFEVTIPKEERDDTLTDRLRAEWPGILAWMVAGCREWQRGGLAPPASVTDATDAYLASEDSFAAWIDECCEQDKRASERSSDLYASYKAWCQRAGEFTAPQKKFSPALETRGFIKKATETGMRFQGLRIRLAEHSEGAWWDRS